MPTPGLSRCRFGRKEKRRVPVAQPDRASDFGSEGWGFESLQARHLLQGTYADFDAIKKKCVCHLLATLGAKAPFPTTLGNARILLIVRTLAKWRR